MPNEKSCNGYQTSLGISKINRKKIIVINMQYNVTNLVITSPNLAEDQKRCFNKLAGGFNYGFKTLG
jgi:hypothetical protein